MPLSILRLLQIPVLLALPWFYGLTGFKHQLVTECILLVFFLVLVLLSLRFHDLPFQLNIIDKFFIVALLLGLFFVAISSIRYLSLLTWVRFCTVILFYFYARILIRDGKALDRYTWTLIGMGVFYTLYGLLQYYGPISSSYWYQESSMGSRYVNGGHFACLLLIPVFLAIYQLLVNKNLIVKALLLASLLIMLWGMILTRSRSVWISLVVAVALFVLILFWRGQMNKKSMLALVIIVAIAIVGLVFTGGWQKIAGRFLEIWDGERLNAFSLIHRLQFWEGSLNAIMARPWGWGMGTFVHIFPKFAVHGDRFLTDYAHNETMQIGVDFGLIGIVFFVTLFCVYIRRFLDWLEVEENRTHMIAGTAIFCGVLGILLTSQFDFPLRIYATSLIFVFFLAMQMYLFELGAKKGANESGKSRIVNVGRVVVIVLIIFSITVSGRQLFAQLAFEQGQKFEEDFRWNEALASYEKAHERAGWYPDYPEALGRLFRKKMALSFDPEERSENGSKAIDSFRKAVQLQPHWPGNFYVLGLLYRELGDRENADKFFEQAVLKGPHNALFLSDYAFFLLQSGDTKRSIDLFERYQKAGFKEGTRSNPCEILRKVVRYTKDFSDLKRVVSTNRGDRICLGQVMGEIGQWDKSYQEMDAAIEMSLAEYDQEYFMEHIGRGIANFYIKHKQYKKAREIYQNAVGKTSKDQRYKQAIKEIDKKIKTAGLGI